MTLTVFSQSISCYFLFAFILINFGKKFLKKNYKKILSILNEILHDLDSF